MTSTQIHISPLPPAISPLPKTHHVRNSSSGSTCSSAPPTSFKNPWPSYGGISHSPLSLLSTRFGSKRNFVPVPASREELVRVRTPDWGGRGQDDDEEEEEGGEGGGGRLKATWLGHAGFLVEIGRPSITDENSSSSSPDGKKKNKRGVRILFDAVFAERVGPWGMVGPRRFTPTPCKLEEVPEVDVFAVSHNHYDHLDVEVVRYLWRRGGEEKGGKRVKFVCALGQRGWFEGVGIRGEDVVELDWWEGVEVWVGDGMGEGKGGGGVKVGLTCTPCQHASGRGVRDQGKTLWCSWVVRELGGEEEEMGTNKRLFFAGDTAYRTVTEETINADPDSLPHCPAFKEIGQLFGPFDLSLLPIGCFMPRTFMSQVHCAPVDSICIHKDIKSKKSIGMHWGSIRGGLSAQYEDVREPPRQWRAAAEKEGLEWGTEIGLCDVGETVVV
ncbi:MAG: hypothetical protein Q9227_001880 [Pyrenula ochraceoflavens]